MQDFLRAHLVELASRPDQAELLERLAEGKHRCHTPLLEQIWTLRDNLSAYDASYVAVAEAFELPVATLDHRLVRAGGPRCTFLTP